MPSKVRRGLGPRRGRGRRFLLLRGRHVDLRGHLTEEGSAEDREGQAEKEETDEGESGQGGGTVGQEGEGSVSKERGLGRRRSRSGSGTEDELRVTASIIDD